MLAFLDSNVLGLYIFEESYTILIAPEIVIVWLEGLDFNELKVVKC